jgi:hypothetical protein
MGNDQYAMRNEQKAKTPISPQKFSGYSIDGWGNYI